MKSIKQQYIDLQEGNMSQANFMRNLRMTLPQYVTNVTSFEDSVRILKNKGILTEADTAEGKYKKVTGKDLYDHFKEVDNLNGQEVLVGIDYEMIKNPELTKLEAEKIVIKNLKKNPIYYTAKDMSGVEGYEPETMGPKADIEARQMQPLDKNMGNVVDKKMGMQPVKGIEKPKKDADKATAQKYKTSGIDMMSLIAKTVRGLKKMDATGEKMKKVTVKENKETTDDKNKKPAYKSIFDKHRSTVKGTNAIGKGENPNKEKSKLTKDDLMEMIREELKEMFDGYEPMGRKGLDEAKLFADFKNSFIPKTSLKSRFARSISEIAREYYHMDNIDIPGYFDEYKDGDKVYAGPTESLKFFQKLPNEFIVTNNIDGVNESFKITKTGPDSFTAEEI